MKEMGRRRGAGRHHHPPELTPPAPPMRLSLPAALLALLAGLAAPASGQGSAEVTGVVVDSTDAGLAGATVVVPPAGRLRHRRVRRDAGGRGVPRPARAAGRLPPPGHVGRVRPVPRAHTRVGGGGLDAGRVRLDAAVGALDALVVRADRVPMVVRGDTLAYNADAFGVAPGSTVEDLLRRLPGVEVDRDGSVQAQGEAVNKVLVDGKEFFGGDPTVATRNLPADAVDRVEVFDKKSDAAEFTGVDDGQEAKTINLALKEDRRKGTFGTMSGGLGGTAEAADDALRFDGRATVNRFSPSTQLSLIANANNVNRQGFGVGDYVSFMGGASRLGGGGGRIRLGGPGAIPLGDDVGDGFTTTVAGGVNLSHEFGAGTEVQASYFLDRVHNEQDRRVQQQLLFGEGRASLVDQDQDQTTRTLGHRLALSARHEFGEGHDLRLRVNGTASDGALESLDRRETRGAEGAAETASTTAYDSDSGALNGDAQLTYRRRFAGDRSLVAEVGAGLGDTDGDGDLLSTTRFARAGGVPTTEELAQLQTEARTTVTDRQKLLFTQPFGDHALQLSAERRQTAEDQDQAVLDRVGGSLVPNASLSSAFERAYRYYQGGATYRRNGETVSLSLGLDAQHAQLAGSTPASEEAVEEGYLSLLPSATLSYSFSQSRSAELRYQTSTREPSLRDLQPVPDNRDPLNVYVGNPDLRPEYTHSLNARYVSFDAFTSTTLFAFARAGYTTRSISTARTVDEQLRQTTTPVNVGGTWTAFGSASFGTPVRPLRSKVNVSLSTLYNRGVAFVNGDENGSDIVQTKVDLGLENRNKDVWDLRGGARYTFYGASYSLNPQLDQDYVNRTFYAEVGVSPAEGWRFKTTFDLALYARDLFAGGEDVPMWKAEASRSVMGGRGRIELVATDLLDRNVGVTYTNTAAYVQESRVNSLGRYALLRFAYDLGGGGPGRGIRTVTVGR